MGPEMEATNSLACKSDPTTKLGRIINGWQSSGLEQIEASSYWGQSLPPASNQILIDGRERARKGWQRAGGVNIIICEAPSGRTKGAGVLKFIACLFDGYYWWPTEVNHLARGKGKNKHALPMFTLHLSASFPLRAATDKTVPARSLAWPALFAFGQVDGMAQGVPIIGLPVWRAK